MKKHSMLLLFIISFTAVSVQAEEPVYNWKKVTPHAAWQPRDSQGELVYDGKLWIFGGWFNSFAAPPRDVWSSADGKNWKQVAKQAPWKHSDLSMSVTFKKKMWFMGGWYNGRLKGHSAGNEVWSSTDGSKWKQATKAANWSPRCAATLVNFKKKMWLLGGTENYYFGDDKSLKNDVWSSADGKDWTLETKNAGWSPRAYHQSVVHDGKIWVMGGGNYTPEYKANNDVWSSTDGIHWKQVTKSAPWNRRLWFSSVVYRGHIWVISGWSKKPNQNWGDVWYSKDGKNWKQLKSKITWKERHEISAFVFQDKIWIAGGHAKPLSNEVWSLQLPKNWDGK